MLTIIASMEHELAGLRKELGRMSHAFGRRMPAACHAVWTDLHVVGVGRLAAETTVRSLLNREGKFDGYSDLPQGLLMLGFAGAVDPPLETGTLVLSSRYYRSTEETNFQDSSSLGNPPKPPLIKGGQRGYSLPTTLLSSPDEGLATGDYLAPDPGMLHRAVTVASAVNPKWVEADSLTVDRLVTSTRSKQVIRQEYPVAIVDMEDYWIAAAARQAGVPFLSARVVLDRADQALPGYLPGLSRSRAKAVMTATAMPWRIPALLRLGRQLPIAQETLTKFAFTFLAELIGDEPAHPDTVPSTSISQPGSAAGIHG